MKIIMHILPTAHQLNSNSRYKLTMHIYHPNQTPYISYLQMYYLSQRQTRKTDTTQNQIFKLISPLFTPSVTFQHAFISITPNNHTKQISHIYMTRTAMHAIAEVRPIRSM